MCDNEIRNGASTASDPNYACQQRCPGKYTQFCGGFGSGQLYEACTGNGCFQNANIPAQATAALDAADTATTTFASSGTVTKQMSTTAAVATTSTSVEVSSRVASKMTSIAMVTSTAEFPSKTANVVTKTRGRKRPVCTAKHEDQTRSA